MRRTPTTSICRPTCPSRVFAAAACLLAVASPSPSSCVSASSARTFSSLALAFQGGRFAPSGGKAHVLAGLSSRSCARPMTATSRLGSSATAAGNAAGGAQQSTNDPLVEMGLPSPLILGSGSFTRKLILKEMGIKYELVVRPIDEKGLGDRDGDPGALVSTLAKAKGDHLVSNLVNGGDESDDLPDKATEGHFGGYVILTADQVVTHDGAILEKPENVDEARDFVSRYADSPPQTVGACVLTHIPSGVQVSGVDSARINFSRSVADGDLVGRLLEDGAPVLSCAGGLMVEHPLVREHLESIDGTEDSVMGLSKDLVLRLLSEMKEKLRSERLR